MNGYTRDVTCQDHFEWCHDGRAGAEEIRDGFLFLGGRLWLDFLNSAPATMGELIATPEDLARWTKAAGIERGDRAAFSRGDVTAAHALRCALGAIARAGRRRAAARPRARRDQPAPGEAPRLRRVEAAKGPCT